MLLRRWILMGLLCFMGGCTALDNFNTVMNPPPTIHNKRSYQADMRTTFKAVVLTVKDYQWPVSQIDDTQYSIKLKTVDDKTFNQMNQWTAKNAYNAESPDCQEGQYDIAIDVQSKAQDDTEVNIHFSPRALGCKVADNLPLSTYWSPIYSNGVLEQAFLDQVAVNMVLVR